MGPFEFSLLGGDVARLLCRWCQYDPCLHSEFSEEVLDRCFVPAYNIILEDVGGLL